MDIRKKGGTGQGLALSACWSSMGGGGAPRNVFVFWRYALMEPLVPAAHQNIMHGWPGILKEPANAIFSYEEVLRAIGDLPRAALEEFDTDEESEGTRAESDRENESE